MNVLHIISSGGMYGAEAVILNLSRTLKRNGDRSILGVFENSAQPNLQLHHAAAQEGIESHAISCEGQVDLSVPKRIRELAATTRADIVHAHGYKGDIYTALALRRTGRPIVSTCHNWLDDSAKVKLYGAADRWSLRGFDHVIAVSEEVRTRLIRSGIPAGRISLIANGVSLEPFQNAVPSLRTGDPERSLVVGLVGRLSPEKGIDVLIEAAALTRKAFPEVQFVVAGEGPERSSLETLIAQRGLASSFKLLGRREDIPSVYASLDVVVMASHNEGLPIAILEAMASARPIVSTAVGEIPSVLQDGVTGLLVPPAQPEALAAAIGALLESPERRRHMGEAAREQVRARFSAESMTAEYTRVYRSLLLS